LITISLWRSRSEFATLPRGYLELPELVREKARASGAIQRSAVTSNHLSSRFGARREILDRHVGRKSLITLAKIPMSICLTSGASRLEQAHVTEIKAKRGSESSTFLAERITHPATLIEQARLL